VLKEDLSEKKITEVPPAAERRMSRKEEGGEASLRREPESLISPRGKRTGHRGGEGIVLKETVATDD